MSWLNRSTGIAGWWSDTIGGSASAVGDAVRLSFPTTEVPFDLRAHFVDDLVAVGESGQPNPAVQLIQAWATMRGNGGRWAIMPVSDRTSGRE